MDTFVVCQPILEDAIILPNPKTFYRAMMLTGSNTHGLGSTIG
jgi:hypothetical protein